MTHVGRSPPGHTPVTVKKNGSLSTDTSTDDAIGTMMPGVRLWGHRIKLNGDDGISCEECEMAEEIPDLLQMTNGHRQVLWKMYILGKFKRTDCEPQYETDGSVLHTNTTNVGGIGKIRTSSGRELDKLTAMVVPQNQRLTIAGEQWEHDGHGTWHSHDSPNVKRSGEMKRDFGKEFTSMLAMATTDPQDDIWKDPRDGGVSIGDMSTKSGANPSSIDGVRDRTSLNVDSDLDEDEKKSLKDKLVSALSNGKTTLR